MPVNYTDSKIFCIKSFETDKVYIGATTKRLPQRIASLKDSYKKYLNGSKKIDDSYEILKYNDAYIQLLESCSVKNKDELNSKLIEMIERYKDKCVNGQKKKTTPKKEIITEPVKTISEDTETASESEIVEIVEPVAIINNIPNCYMLPTNF